MTELIRGNQEDAHELSLGGERVRAAYVELADRGAISTASPRDLGTVNPSMTAIQLGISGSSPPQERLDQFPQASDRSVRLLQARTPLRRAARRSDSPSAPPGFRHSPNWVRRVIAWSQAPRSGAPNTPISGLRPLKRRVLHWHQQGAEDAEIGSRFRRSRGFIEQVEHLAHKLAS